MKSNVKFLRPVWVIFIILLVVGIVFELLLIFKRDPADKPIEKPIEKPQTSLSVSVHGQELSDGACNICLNSGDLVTISGVQDYSVAVYAYRKDETNEFFVVKEGTGQLYDWLAYQNSVDPFTGVAEKDFLKYEKSGLKLNKTAVGFSLSYNGFEDFIGADVAWLPIHVGINIEDIYKCDKFRAEITSGDTVFNFSFNITDDWVKLCTSPSQSSTTENEA